jgi:hypothetical protein
VYGGAACKGPERAAPLRRRWHRQIDQAIVIAGIADLAGQNRVLCGWLPAPGSKCNGNGQSLAGAFFAEWSVDNSADAAGHD